MPYWKQQNGINAMWLVKSPNEKKYYWIFELEDKLGTSYADIVLPTSSIAIWPHQIVDGFYYFDGTSFKLASSSDVTINDCKTAFKISLTKQMFSLLFLIVSSLLQTLF